MAIFCSINVKQSLASQWANENISTNHDDNDDGKLNFPENRLNQIFAIDDIKMSLNDKLDLIRCLS